ncbi:MAG TPA: Holliday junction resolvase RuvX [Trueperaceae bacterium]|nr:Holliday junction resolvase RuvX [Trueperaceae bacterium]HRQ09947.1 Holliday junction resolvase RuvX [Trueperaceae bacterium]
MALDVGDARIGLATGTVGSLLAFGRGSLTRQGTRKDVAALLAMLADEGMAAVVVGLPVRLGGEESAQTERVRRFAAELRAAGARVEFEDERLTTRIAQRQVGASGLPRSRRQEKGRLDEAAAVLILESYLRRVKGQE